MNTEDTERSVRALAQAASLPAEFDTWPGVVARLPRLRRQRIVRRAAISVAAAAVVAVALAVPLSPSAPASAKAVARRAATVALTGGALPPLELTQVITNAPIGFQPEPPPPRITEHIQYAGPDRWRDTARVTEPFGEGVQTITRIRNGPRIAIVSGGRATIMRAAGHAGFPFAASVAGGRAAVRALLGAGSTGGCAPRATLDTHGPLIDGRPTLVLHIGAAPCPSADIPQADGPATFWLDSQTFLILRAVLHGPGDRLAETITVTGLRYHRSFPAGTFRLPRPAPARSRCPTAVSLPSVAALRANLAYPPLLPARLPPGLSSGVIQSSGATTADCKITEFTVTYRDRLGRPAVQLYEAPRSSPSVRFPGRTVTIRPGLTGTLNTGSGMTILWWIQDGRYCSIQSGGITAGVRLTGIPDAELIRMAASLRR